MRTWEDGAVGVALVLSDALFNLKLAITVTRVTADPVCLEAAKAYDRALVNTEGITAQTNFDVTHYVELLSTLQPDHTPPHLQTAPHSSTSFAVSHPFPDRE